MIEIISSQITFLTILFAFSLTSNSNSARNIINIKNNETIIDCQSKLILTALRVTVNKPETIIIPHYLSLPPFKVFPDPDYS